MTSDSELFEVVVGANQIVVPTGTTVDVAVDYQATALGFQMTTLQILSDAINQPALTVDVQGRGVDTPILRFEPERVNFSPTFTGTATTADFRFTNEGVSSLDVSWTLEGEGFRPAARTPCRS